ncbi:MAG: hypothetical protein PVI40_04270 [Chlamydiota bacterium]|jgi:tetratricopeptide (TPR) repeat protein
MAASTPVTHLTHLRTPPLCSEVEADSERTFFVNELPVELIKLINSHIANSSEEDDLQSSFNFLFHASQVCLKKFPEQSLHFQGECEKAILAANNSLSGIDHQNFEDKIKIAQSYILLGKLTEAETCLHELQNYYKKMQYSDCSFTWKLTELFSKFAEAYMQSGDLDKAKEQIQKAKNYIPEKSRDYEVITALLQLAKTCATIGLKEESETLFNHAENYPLGLFYEPQRLQDIGKTYLQLRNVEQAKKIFEKLQECIKSSSSSVIVASNFTKTINCLLDLRQSVPAQDIQLFALSFLQNCSAYGFNASSRFVCYSYARFGLYNEIIKIGNPKILLDIIQDCIEAKDSDLALSLLAECENFKIRDHDDKQVFLLKLINAHIQLKNFDKAKCLLEMSEALISSSCYPQQSYIDYAYAYFSLGDTEKAKSFLDATFKYMDFTYIKDIMKAYMHIGCFSEVKDILQRAEQQVEKSSPYAREMDLLEVVKTYVKLSTLDEKERDNLLGHVKNIMETFTTPNYRVSSLIELTKAYNTTDAALSDAFLQQALAIGHAYKKSTPVIIFNSLIVIALGYADLQKPEQAKTYLLEAKEVIQNDKAHVKITSLLKLVNIYIQLKDLIEAKNVLQEIESTIWSSHQSNPKGIPTYFLRLAHKYAQLKDFSKAEELLGIAKSFGGSSTSSDLSFFSDLDDSYDFLNRCIFIHELKSSRV